MCLCSAGKDHVCRFVGCGQNERFTYVVMELQVGFLSALFAAEAKSLYLTIRDTSFVSQGEKSGRFTQNHEWRHLLCLNHFTTWKADFRGHREHPFCRLPAPRYQTCELSTLLQCNFYFIAVEFCFCLSLLLKL